MTIMSGSNLSPSGGPAAGRSRGTMIALVALMAVVLFAAGVGLSWLLRGGNDSGAAPGAGASPTCVTTTTVPGVGLPKPATVSVNVYNATDQSGLAARTGITLKGRGFTVGTIANDPLGKTVNASAEIRYGPKGAKNAEMVQFYVAGSKLVLDQRTDASVDVVLGEKFKSVRTADAVQSAMNKPVVTSTGPGCAKPPAAPAASPTA